MSTDAESGDPVSVPRARADRSVRLYDAAYARRYRQHDDRFDASDPCCRFADWLRRICGMFPRPIDVLDLGCGTGRYFWTLRGVRDLVGLDVSPPMLVEAGRPYNAERIDAKTVTLIAGDLHAHEFEPERFDLIYSIGVLAEHAPLDRRLTSNVARWLRPDGRFAFTTVHPDSPSIPRTWRRRLGASLAPVAPGPMRERIRERLLARGMYADEAEVSRLLKDDFDIESLVRFESEAHLHCLCVARKTR